MNREIFKNYFIGKYGEDLVITTKKNNKDYYLFKSFVLNDFRPVEIAKEDKEIILKLYCEYGYPEAINKEDLKALKWRANNLSTLFTFIVTEYLKTKNEKHLKDAKTILDDLDILELNEEQYLNWFTNDVHKTLVDEKNYRNKLIEEHNKLKQATKSKCI